MSDEILIQNTDAVTLAAARDNVKLALSASADWRKEAREDYRFVQGFQWTREDRDALKKQGRPCITINRCRPMVNMVSGYATMNAFEPDFLPRGYDDDEICRAAKGITKYVYDRCNYKREKKKVFRDKLICGLGNFWVFYDFDYESMEGNIKIERKSPFDVFIDPESSKENLADAKYCGLFSWSDPDELASIFPELETEIKAIPHKYDEAEVEGNTVSGEPLWYSKQLKKVRVVQYWYKETSHKTVYEVAPGKIVDAKDILSDMALLSHIQINNIQGIKLPATTIKFMTFCDNLVLEHKESPYRHKRFPLVREYAYYTGEKDDDHQGLEPAGIIRDLKDVQREVNKQRSQRMHIVNTQANGIWLIYGQSTPKFEEDLKKFGTTPGAKINVPLGVTRVERVSPDGISTANVELEKSSTEDFYQISGINPETLGYGMPSQISGKAIDLRQRSTTIQTADLYDEQQHAERQVLDLLWGDVGRPGLIPQYFTEEMTIRIIGDDGKNDFIALSPNQPQAVNQQPAMNPDGSPVVDQSGQLIQKVLYDLTKFQFDIVINESPSTPTTRLSNLYQLQDAAKSGIQIPPDILLEFMDFPGKEDVKKRIQEASSQHKPEPPKTSLSISFKDLPLEAKMALLQAEGIQVDPNSLMQQEMLKNQKPVTQPPNPGGY